MYVCVYVCVCRYVYRYACTFLVLTTYCLSLHVFDSRFVNACVAIPCEIRRHHPTERKEEGIFSFRVETIDQRLTGRLAYSNIRQQKYSFKIS